MKLIIFQPSFNNLYTLYKGKKVFLLDPLLLLLSLSQYLMQSYSNNLDQYLQEYKILIMKSNILSNQEFIKLLSQLNFNLLDDLSQLNNL